MGRFSKRCRTLAQSMLTLAKRTKSWGNRSSRHCTISMPEPALQSGQIDCVPTKRRFWRTVPISSIVRFGDFHLRPRACLVAILAWHICPTSARDAPHSWLISPWSNHECTTTTHGSGRGMPCTQVLATKPCGCQALQATRSSPWPEVKIPKADKYIVFPQLY